MAPQSEAPRSDAPQVIRPSVRPSAGRPVSTIPPAYVPDDASTEALREIDFMIENDLLDEAEELLGELMRSQGESEALNLRVQQLMTLRSGGQAPEVPPSAELGGFAEAFASMEGEGFDFLDGEDLDLGSIQGAQLEELDGGDAQTHLDLGLAFREMQQLSKAVEQLKLAEKSPFLRPEALRLQALCAADRGDLETAQGCLERALTQAGLGETVRLGLRYEQAKLHEQAGDSAQTLSILQEIKAQAPRFQGIDAHIARLAR